MATFWMALRPFCQDFRRFGSIAKREAGINVDQSEGSLPVHRTSGLRPRIATVLNVCQAALRVCSACCRSGGKAVPGKSVLRSGDAAAQPFSPSLDIFRTAWAAIVVEVSGPALLAAGFLVRAVALLMLVLTLLAQSRGAPRDEHLFWAALFGWYVVQGAGPLPLDNVLGQHQDLWGGPGRRGDRR